MVIQTGEKRLVIRAAESLHNKPVDEDLWVNVSCEPQKCYVLKCTDDDDELFDEKLEESKVLIRS